jgi:hypothetical protein
MLTCSRTAKKTMIALDHHDQSVTKKGVLMLIMHDQSDEAILAGWRYFHLWRKSRNALLLLDALEKLNCAENAWTAVNGRRKPLRREWQVLRRCVMRGLGRLRVNLLEAHSQEETESALYRGGKRATLARADQLNDLAVVTALVGSTLEQAGATLQSWGKPRAKSYLKKRASQLGLTRRQAKSVERVEPKGNRRTQQARSAQVIEIGPGRRRHRGTAY